MSISYDIVPIDPSAADALRAAGGERYVADAYPGYPCRQCLRDADLGEVLLLVAHDPFSIDSPYRCSSPIFLHEHSCEPPTEPSAIPAQLSTRQLSVRAFDDESMMVDAAVIDGTSLDTTLEQFFGDARTHEIHIHNATRGCWAARATRREPQLPADRAVMSSIVA